MSNNRYIVLLNTQKEEDIRNIEKDFSISVTSSEMLSKDNRSFEIINSCNAVLYKNLGAMVFDDVDEEILIRSLADASNPIIYFEKERDFYPVDELSIINNLKEKLIEFNGQLLELEAIISRKTVPEPEPIVTDLEWGLKAIGIEKTNHTGKGINLCVCDTGFDTSHPDFANRTIEGKSFVPNENWDKDLNGHGTHCTGIACGYTRNDTGKRYGIAKDCNIIIGKVLNKNGNGRTNNIIDAIDWAITKNCRIVSLSLGSPARINEKPSMLFETIGKKALDNNCLLIAAAGNDSQRPNLPAPVSVPANSPSIMAVAAIDKRLKIASFSNGGINPNSGGEINVCAPGVNILSSYSTVNNKTNPYRALDGTSMATPHVSGLAALYMEQFPNLDARAIWKLLEDNSKQLDNTKSRDIGKGLIQALAK